VKTFSAAMPAPPCYKDLTKVVDDLLNDDFSLKNTIKVKHSTPQAVNFTIENESKHSGVAGKVSVKYAHRPSGFSLDKLSIGQDGSKSVECSVAGLAPGLKLTAKVDDIIRGDVGVEYFTPKFSFKSEIDSELSKVISSATMSYEGVNAGGIVKYKLPGEKVAAVKDYNVGVSYGGKGWFAALTTSEKMTTYNFSATYSPAKNITAALLASTTPETSAQSVDMGVKYVCNPKTTVRAKACSTGDVHAAVQHKCVQGLVVGMATKMNAKERQPKFGFNCTLG
jgi:hypothetical protein